MTKQLRGVAQFGRVLRSGRRCRWFKSSHLDKKEYRYEAVLKVSAEKSVDYAL